MTDPLLTPDEVAALLRVEPRTLRRLREVGATLGVDEPTIGHRTGVRWVGGRAAVLAWYDAVSRARQHAAASRSCSSSCWSATRRA